MAFPSKPECSPKFVVLLEGSVFRIGFAVSQNGDSKARDYLEGLSPSDQRKFAPLFQRLGGNEKLRVPERFRRLEDAKIQVHGTLENVAIWELKIDGHRLLTFRNNKEWVLTNGCPKIGKKSFQAEIQVAIHIATDYLNR